MGCFWEAESKDPVGSNPTSPTYEQVEFDTAVSILHKCKTVGETLNPANSDVENCEEFVDSSVKMLNNVDNELVKATREPVI